jgi:hypothetical protein
MIAVYDRNSSPNKRKLSNRFVGQTKAFKVVTRQALKNDMYCQAIIGLMKLLEIIVNSLFVSMSISLCMFPYRK